MKKILLVTGSLKIGGLETVAMKIVKLSDLNKYHFDFLVYGQEVFRYETEAKSLGCNVFHIQEPKKGYLKYYFELKKCILENGPYDIVHAHTYFNSGLVMMAAKKSKVALCIAQSHSIKRTGDSLVSKKIIYGILRKILNKYTDKVCACSLEAGNYVFGQECFSKKGVVILNPVDLYEYRYLEEHRKSIRQELNIASEQIVIGQVGRLVSGKNQEFLMEVFFQYCKKHNAILILAGDGELRKHLEAYSERLHIKENVRILGKREDVNKLLSAMDIFLMTSKHEGMGIVIVEALANGLYCLCNKTAIVKKITDLEGCIALDDFNTEKWCEKIDYILSRGRKKQCDVDTMLSEFGEEKFIRFISDLYEEKNDMCICGQKKNQKVD